MRSREAVVEIEEPGPAVVTSRAGVVEGTSKVSVPSFGSSGRVPFLTPADFLDGRPRPRREVAGVVCLAVSLLGSRTTVVDDLVATRP